MTCPAFFLSCLVGFSYKKAMPNKQNRTKRPIQLMPPELQNQIAAGEVVERPSSVLKELVENSLDAGATSVSATIDQGGQGLIEVKDNGFGMTPEEMKLSLTRHATSKVVDIDELATIDSFGFRGEALPSIASVSCMTMTSITTDADEGYRLEIKAGKIEEEGPTAGRAGTSISIRDLFLNVPARLKFLKTANTESKRCQDAFFRLALTRPDVRFSFTSGGRKIFTFRGGETLPKRLSRVWPPAITDYLKTFDVTRDDYRAHGVSGDPQAAQGRGDRILLYVNGRPVADKLLMRAVREAYTGRLLSREFPQAVVFLELPPEDVDVNVHPAKSEVRFRHESKVFSVVRRGILSALEDSLTAATPGGYTQQRPAPSHGAEPTSGYSSRYNDVPPPPPGGKTISRPGFNTYREFNRVSAQEQSLEITPPPRQSPPPTMDELPNTFAQPEAPQTGESYLGQLADTYLILKGEDGTLSLVDQHAAHERVLYHSFESAGTRGDSQPLAVPLDLPLHPSEAQRLQELWSGLRELGFELDTPAPEALSIRAVPSQLAPSKAKEFLRSAVSGKADDLKALWAMLSCKAAIKAGQTLAKDEALALLDAWKATPEKEYCPHGRPIRVAWSTADLEKLFKRRT